MRKLFKLITWPIVSLLELIFLGLLKLAEWGINLFIKIGDKIVPMITGNNINLDPNDPKTKDINKYSHNIDAIIKDIWVPDKKMDAILGTSAINEDLKVPDMLTDEELIYCYKKSLHYYGAVTTFSKNYLGEFTKLTDECLKNMQARFEGKKGKGRYFNDSMFRVKYIRKVWKKALRETKQCDGKVPEKREELIAGIQANMIITRVSFTNLFLTMYKTMLYMGVNFYGDKIPLYNI